MAAAIEPELSMRAMRESDVADVMVIEETVYEFPWTDGIFRDCLRVGYLCYAVEYQKKLIGYAVISIAANECHILNVAISKGFRGKGYGRVLMHYLLEQASVMKPQIVFLEVRPSNVVAVQLYLSMGFSEVGVRKDYYPAKDGREDALILAYELNVE